MTVVAGRPPRLLRNREYVGLAASKAVSVVGDQLARVALTVLVYDRTRNAVLAALAYAGSFLPAVVGGPLLGGLADRTPPRRLLVAVDVARAALYALMAAPGVPVGVLLALVVTATTVGQPWGAARQSVLRQVLVDDAGYRRGTALDETLEQSGQLAGFAAGGVLVAALGPSAALLADAVSFLASAVLVRSLLAARPAPAPDQGPRAGPGASPAGLPSTGGGVPSGSRGRVRRAGGDAASGWRAATAPACRGPLLLTWAGFTFASAPAAVAVPWAADLGGGPVAVGLLYAAVPAGSVAGLLLVGRAGPAAAARLLRPLAVFTVAPLVVCGAGPPLPVVLALLVLCGVGSAFNVLARTGFVRGVAASHRGRAFAVASAGLTAGQGLGIAAAGVLGQAVGPGTAVGVMGAAGLVAVLAVAATTLSPARAGQAVDGAAG